MFLAWKAEARFFLEDLSSWLVTLSWLALTSVESVVCIIHNAEWNTLTLVWNYQMEFLYFSWGKNWLDWNMPCRKISLKKVLSNLFVGLLSSWRKRAHLAARFCAHKFFSLFCCLNLKYFYFVFSVDPCCLCIQVESSIKCPNSKDRGAAAYQLGNISSRTITEVKQRWARLVLGWETVQVLPECCC